MKWGLAYVRKHKERLKRAKEFIANRMGSGARTQYQRKTIKSNDFIANTHYTYYMHLNWEF